MPLYTSFRKIAAGNTQIKKENIYAKILNVIQVLFSLPHCL